MINYLGFLDFGGPVEAIIILVVLAVFAFEIFMFVSAVTNKYISDSARVFWAIGMLLLHPVVAIVYYFTDHQKHNA